eukprot:CAMPEP_0172599882 /NCGR_PEP_ID=MMETSP1068-20121228/20008_1 /TAXON_ID=35684 /ORGANISM="Pseudopedinella elastica, Strain CCMP716" /LENGTH=169 /DNA_ID=CAMNT_0013400289 /DNA_START=78 /DNA_END=587 /DNA_ORIENTATION=-
MSTAHEIEINAFCSQLRHMETERNEALAMVEESQAALLEAKLKARRAVEACKKDALDIAATEAVRHATSKFEMECMLDRCVGQNTRFNEELSLLKGTICGVGNVARAYEHARECCRRRREDDECSVDAPLDAKMGSEVEAAITAADSLATHVLQMETFACRSESSHGAN